MLTQKDRAHREILRVNKKIEIKNKLSQSLSEKSKQKAKNSL